MAVITISHPPFSCGRQIAERVASILGYRSIGREVLFETSRRYDIQESELVDSLEKDQKHWWSRWLGHQSNYRLALQATLYELAQTDNLVYHGRAGEVLFAGLPGILKVLLDTPTDMRVRQAVAYTHVCDDAALQYLHRLDNIRARRMRELFEKDWRDRNLYDLGVTLADGGVDETAERIAKVAQSSPFQNTPERNAAFSDHAIKAIAEARLTLSEAGSGLQIEIHVNDGKVRLSGVLADSGIRNVIVKMIETIPGVTEVATDFLILPAETLYSYPT